MFASAASKPPEGRIVFTTFSFAVSVLTHTKITSATALRSTSKWVRAIQCLCPLRHFSQKMSTLVFRSASAKFAAAVNSSFTQFNKIVKIANYVSTTQSE